MKNKIITLTAVASLALTGILRAEVTSSAFLKIGAGAEAAALGGAYTAKADGPNAIYWNPAGLAGSERSVTLTHTALYDEASHDFAAFSAKGLGGNVGAAITWLSYGSINGRDINGLSADGFSAEDMALSLAYAKSWNKDLNVGLAGKYIHSRIGSETGGAFALDAGVNWLTPVKNLKAAFTAQNLGPEFKFAGNSSPLPLTWGLGASYTGINKLELTLDGRTRPKDGDDELCLGAGYRLAKALVLRAGYNSKAAKPAKSEDTKGLNALDNLRGLSAGFGVEISNFKLDYAFTPYGELGNVQRITLTTVF
jgi:hypothetical protein